MRSIDEHIVDHDLARDELHVVGLPRSCDARRFLLERESVDTWQLRRDQPRQLRAHLPAAGVCARASGAISALSRRASCAYSGWWTKAAMPAASVASRRVGSSGASASPRHSLDEWTLSHARSVAAGASHTTSRMRSATKSFV